MCLILIASTCNVWECVLISGTSYKHKPVMVVCVAVEAGAGLVVAHSASVFVSCYLSDTTYRA